MLPKTVISNTSNTYAKKSKRLGIGKLPILRLKMVIFIYSNILSSVSMMNTTALSCYMCGQERPLRLFEVLARNRQSAVGLLGRILGTQETTTPNVYNTSSTTTVHYQKVGLTKTESYAPHNKHTHTHTRKRDTQRERNTPFTLVKKETHSP